MERLFKKNQFRYQWFSVLGLFILTGVLFFYKLGERSLWESDEVRYAEIAREMLQFNDWITPHLNYVKYLEKPILTYWLIAFCFKFFGISAFTARLTPAFFGFLTIILVFFLGRSMWNIKSGLIASFCLSTSLMFFFLSRILIVDMLLCFGIILSLYGVWILRQKLNYAYYFFWGGCVIGFLTKGLLGLGIPIMILLIFVIITNEWIILKRVIKLRGIFFFILLSAPWIILVSWVNPEFLSMFFIDENFARLLTTKHQRYQPLYFYLFIIPGALFPWIVLLPWSLWYTWPGKIWRTIDQRAWLYILISFLSMFFLFSFSQSKMIHYALPMLFPLTLIIGKALSSFLYKDWLKGSSFSLIIISLSIGGLAIILLIASITILIIPFIIKEISYKQMNILLFLAPLSLSMLGLIIFIFRQEYWIVWVGPVLVLLILVILSSLIIPRLDNYRSVEGLLFPITNKITNCDIFVNYGDYYYGTVFFSKRRVIAGSKWGELEFGRNFDPENKRWFLFDHIELLQLLQNFSTRVIVISETQKYLKLKRLIRETPEVFLFEWCRLGDKSLFSNRPYPR